MLIVKLLSKDLFLTNSSKFVSVKSIFVSSSPTKDFLFSSHFLKVGILLRSLGGDNDVDLGESELLIGNEGEFAMLRLALSSNLL